MDVARIAPDVDATTATVNQVRRLVGFLPDGDLADLRSGGVLPHP
ncbi:MAG TPA: hypothetical protein VHB02_02940 [Acidimicrobiales bacterium]|nr:hypothetical protein [Acidimicrobiales bacterium]